MQGCNQWPQDFHSSYFSATQAFSEKHKEALHYHEMKLHVAVSFFRHPNEKKASASNIHCIKLVFIYTTSFVLSDFILPLAAKLAKLQNFKAKLPAHTQAALSAMIAEAQKHGLPELHTKKHQLQAREQLLASFHDPVLGPLVQSIDMELAEGGTTTMYFANFLVYV